MFRTDLRSSDTEKVYIALITNGYCPCVVTISIGVSVLFVSGDVMGIPEAVMGLTLLAAGNSIEDTMSCFFVARNGAASNN